MFRVVRTVISLIVMGVMLWAAFAVDLGGRTFAEHVDAISETPEAEQLVDGTRSKINPTLQEVRDRVLGEYVEAPTWIPAAPSSAPAVPASETSVPASTLPPAQDFEPQLPGRRDDSLARATTDDGGHEPGLPGRR